MKCTLLSASIFISLFTLAQNTPSYIPKNGLVAWWPFTGNALDSSGNGNNGTVNGATLTMDRFGNQNSAYEFNGTSNFISVPDNDLLDLTTQYTLSVWISIPNYSSYIGAFNDSLRTVFGKPRNSGWATGYNITTLPNGQSSKVYTNAANMNCCPHAFAGGQNIPSLNTWVNFIAVYNGSILELYYNGVLVNSSKVSYTIDKTDQPLLIGKEFVLPTYNRYRWFMGKIDDLAIWNRPLSTSEIQGVFMNYGNVGINTTTPQRNLHVNNTMRLEPRFSSPDNPGEGDMYYDGNLHKLRIYDGTTWQNAW